MEKIFELNQIEKEKIGVKYSMQEVAEICTERYFKRQGLIQNSQPTISEINSSSDFEQTEEEYIDSSR